MIEALPRKAACCALVRLGRPDASHEDIEDMAQEAALALWRQWHRGECYAFVCARNAALLWYVRHVWAWRRKDAPPQPTPQAQAVPLPESDEWTWPIAEEEEESDLLMDLLDDLKAIFEARGCTPAAAERYAMVALLGAAGYSLEGVAQELGVSVESAKRYRSEARRILREEIERRKE